MLEKIKAHFVCDECGVGFAVEIDPGASSPAEWANFEIAADAIRGGQNYCDDRGNEGMGCSGSTDGVTHLCHQCTGAKDK